ncbi:MAG: DNA polymerase, partial [Acidaminococcaceae bacterium]
VELRVLAHIAEDPLLLDSFAQGQDVHARTAAEVFGLPLAEVTPLLRSKAKAVNFGIVYGISDYGLSKQLDISRAEAAKYIANYFARYTGVQTYMTQAIATAKQQGYVTTLFGRRRYLPDINNANFNLRSFAERTAINTPIQGTAADIIKVAMINVQTALTQGGFQSRLLLQVHDELVLEVVESEREKVATLVKTTMEKAANLQVPLLADVAWGKNWAETK